MADEKLIFQVELDIAAAAKRASDLNDRLGELVAQRERLTAQRRILAKSLREANKAEAAAIKSKEELRKKIKALEAAEGDNTEEINKLTDQIARLSDEQNKAREDADKYSRELALVESNLKDVRKEINATEKDFKAFPGTLQDNRNELARLKKEYANFRVGVNGTEGDLEDLAKQIKELNDSISEDEQKIGVFSRNVGNYTESVKKAFEALPGPVGQYAGALDNVKEVFKKLKAIGPAGIILGAVAGIAAATAKVVQYGVELDKTREKVRQFSGEQGDRLSELTARVTATSRSFNAEEEDILKASTVFFKEFQDETVRTQNEALGLIREGFVNGANASGEYLDILKEYPAQLKEIGLTGSQSIALISQQPEAGVFSDKGIDAIKEANLRLRELPNSTREALEKIGLDSERIAKELKDGSVTTFEVMQQVSQRLSELPPQSAEAGQAIADIFGGPGEDAGLRYLTSLKDINLNLEEVTANASESAKAQLRISEATERINLQFTKLFSGSSAVFQNLKADALEFAAEGLENIIEGVVSLINFFIDLYNESTLVRGVWEGLKAAGTTLFKFLTLQAKSFFSFFKSAGKIIGAVLKGEFSSIPEIWKEGAEERKNLAEETGRQIGETWSRAIKNTVKREKVALVSLDSDDTEELKKNYKKAGEEAGAAFGEGAKSFRKGKKTIEIEEVKNVDFGEINTIGIDLEKIAKENNEKLRLDKEFFEARLEENKLALKKEAEELALLYDETDEQRINRELQISEELRRIRAAELELQLADLKEGSAAALEIEIELIALRREAKDEELEADRERIEEAKRLEDERLRTARVALQGVIDTTEGIVAAFGEQSAAGKAAIAIQKAATAAQIGINLREQISNAITTGSEIAKIPGAGPILGTLYTAGAIASYTTQAAGLLAELAGFSGGGPTSGDGDKMFIDTSGRLVTQKELTYKGKRVQNVGTFKDGGPAKGPRIGVVAEEGEEYVVPNRVLKTPEGRYYVSQLEDMRRGLVTAFELGGFTAPQDQQSENRKALEEAILSGSIMDRDTIRLIQSLTAIESRVTAQRSIADNSTERREILDGLASNIESTRERVINTVVNTERESAVNSQEIERSLETANFINRQNEAISNARLSELLFSSFISNDESTRERSIGRDTSANVDNMLTTVNKTSSVGERSFVVSPLLSAQPGAAEIIQQIQDIAGPGPVEVSNKIPEGLVTEPTAFPMSPGYVVPNVVLESPEAAQALTAIEKIRTGKNNPLPERVTAFNFGGFTGGSNGLSLDIPAPSGPDFDKVVRAIENLPAPIVLFEDLEEANTRISELNDESTR